MLRFYRHCLPQAQAIQHANTCPKGLLTPRVRKQSALLEISVNTPMSVWELNQVPPIPTDCHQCPKLFVEANIYTITSPGSQTFILGLELYH